MICCERYRVKQVFYYEIFSNFFQVFIDFGMFYYLGHESSELNVQNTVRKLQSLG